MAQRIQYTNKKGKNNRTSINVNARIYELMGDISKHFEDQEVPITNQEILMSALTILLYKLKENKDKFILT